MKWVCQFVIPIGLFLFCADCQKKNINPNSDDGLPPATQIGAGVIACKVNGNPWITHFADPDSYYFTAYLSGDTISFGAFPKIIGTNASYTLGFHLYNIFGSSKTFSLADSTEAFAVCTTDSSCLGTGPYNGSASVHSKNGSVILTKLDTVNKIYSGTFSCFFLIPQCNDTISITEGRFDIRYY